MEIEIGWIHFSEEERKNAKKLAENFDDDESNDPLGLSAVIRKFSDHFFPGIVSGQKHARYYMFGLYLLEMMKEDNSIEDFEDFKEIERKICEKLPGIKGIMGKKSLKQKNQDWLGTTPTEAHWTGIKTFFLKEEYQAYSLREMINEITDSKKDFLKNSFKNVNKEFEDFKSALDNKKKTLSIECFDNEKKFIKDAILETNVVKGTLLGKLLKNPKLQEDKFERLADNIDDWLPAAKELSKIIKCMYSENYELETKLRKEEIVKIESEIFENGNDRKFIYDFAEAKTSEKRENVINERLKQLGKENKNKWRNNNFRYDIVKKILEDLKGEANV